MVGDHVSDADLRTELGSSKYPILVGTFESFLGSLDQPIYLLLFHTYVERAWAFYPH